MSNRTAFAVPKDRQNVTLHLQGGAVLSGTIFLEYTPAELTPHQKVTAFLEDGNAFFPLLLALSGTTEFINKENVRVVELMYAPAEERESLALSLMQSVPVTAVFVNEDTVSGALLAEVPVERARLSDCLNLPGRFLSIKGEDRITYIQKNAILKVVYAEKK